MNAWRGLLRRLRLGSAPRDAAAEADSEIRFHLEERTDELVASGLSRAEARREAERRFGPVDERREELRRLTAARRRAAARRFSLGVAFEALRSARRAVVRHPLPALSAVLSLGFGLAALAGVGTLADEIVLRPPSGLVDPERLVYLDASPISPGPVAESLAQSLGGAAAGDAAVAFGRHLPGSLLAVRGRGEAERVLAIGVDGGYFSTLGVVPRAGRLLDAADEEDRSRVAVVSAALARRHLSHADRAVGNTLHVEGEPFLVVGVAPDAFRGTFHGFPADLWLPLSVSAELDATFDPRDPEADAVEMIARLPGDEGPAAERLELAARLEVAVAPLRDLHPAWRDLALEVHPLTGLDPETYGAVARFVALLTAVALALLAVAALPVALWLLARAATRRREMAIRSALGGSRFQIALLLAAEGLWIGFGAAVGVLLAWPAPAWMSRLLPPLPLELGIEPALRPRLLLLLLGVALATGTLAALPGILQLRRAGLSRHFARRDLGGEPPARAASGLVVAQIAMTTGLLLVAGSLIVAVRAGLRADPGVDLDAILVAQRLDVGSLAPTEGERRRFYQRLADEARGIPGVDAAGVISRFPLSFFGSSKIEISPPGADPRLDPAPDPAPDGVYPAVDFAVIDEGYLAAAEAELLAGRGPRAADGSTAPPVAVVNEELARRWFGSANGAVGKLLRVGDQVHAIVGVVATGRYASALEEPRPFVYLVVSQAPPPRVDLVLRSDRPAEALSEDLRAVLYSLEPDLPPPRLVAGRGVVAARMLPQRLAAGVGTVLGLVGLLLSGLALFAAAAWRVGSRRRELGIRLSLGASPAGLRRAVFAEGLRLAAIGVVAGILLGLVASRAASGAVPGAHMAGPGLTLGVAGLVAVLTLLATLGPARRAARLDPAASLRTE